jgi:F-type H+-transporting ATPase subunit delta
MQRLFASPVFTPENKKAVIKDLAGKLGMQPTTQRFVEHLAETGRIRYVKDVNEAFQEILAERQNRASVRLTTAVPINNGDLADIKQKLEGLTGSRWTSTRGSIQPDWRGKGPDREHDLRWDHQEPA